MSITKFSYKMLKSESINANTFPSRKYPNGDKVVQIQPMKLGHFGVSLDIISFCDHKLKYF